MTDSLRTTPLEAVHDSLGATFTDFAGWRMPVRYDSDLAEHAAVRTSAGLFDLSHMGEIRLRGPEAGAALDHALSGRFSGMPVGRAKYSLLLTEQGTVIDDVIVYRLGEQDYLVVANASNAEADAAELLARAAGRDVEVEDESERTALIAVQGPAAERILLDALLGSDASDAPVGGLDAATITGLGNYRGVQGTYRGAPLLLARTGYTGEDGFELYVPSEHATALWEQLAAAGGDRLVPCGLACRDTLRLEAGMPLYGHELSRDLLPAQSGLSRVVALSAEGDFVGRAAIESSDASALPVLVGLAGEGRRAARAGAAIRSPEGEEVGTITSGALSPTLGHPIAMAFVRPEQSAPGTALVADVRGKDLPVHVVPLPFYSRP
ncbi:glycine cleavage system aminomethyltransferase GcvT [Brachybacterium sp. DNPG3]